MSTTFTPDGTPIATAIEQCRRHGISTIELGSNHSAEQDPLQSVSQSHDTQLLVHNFYPPAADGRVINIASLDPQVRSLSISHAKNCLRFCRSVGAELYTLHPGFLSDPDGTSSDPSSYDFDFVDGKSVDYVDAFNAMVSSLRDVLECAERVGVQVAIETEGSVHKRDHLLMQTPGEFDRLFGVLDDPSLMVNLNIGHLNLAAVAHGFNREDFIDAIAQRVVALELSHNDGVMDDHLPLRADGWYWGILQDARFSDAYKILEYRDTPIDKVADSFRLCVERLDD